MVGQLGQMRPRVGGVGGLKRLPDQPVQVHAPRGEQALVQHLPDQRVREPPAAELTRDRPDHPCGLGLLQQHEEPLGVQAASRLQRPQLEVAAHHRGDLQDPPAVAGEATEPLGHHRPDPLRQPAPEHRGAPRGRIEPALAGQQPDHLGDEERIAVGLPVHLRRQLRRRLRPGDQGDEAGHVLLAQPAKQQPAVLPAGQVGHGGQQRMALIHLGVPVAAHHQRTGTLQLPAHEPQQRQRRHIRPVQVVQDQQQRPARGRRPQEARQAVEQPESGRLRLQRRRGRKIWNAVMDGGD